MKKGDDISEEEYYNILKEVNKIYFEKAAQLINESNVSQISLRWKTLPINPESCGYDIDYSNLSVGDIYVMLYYSFVGKTANEKDCIEMNHIYNDYLTKVLVKLDKVN